jgi:hypothetical protein
MISRSLISTLSISNDQNQMKSEYVNKRSRQSSFGRKINEFVGEINRTIAPARSRSLGATIELASTYPSLLALPYTSLHSSPFTRSSRAGAANSKRKRHMFDQCSQAFVTSVLANDGPMIDWNNMWFVLSYKHIVLSSSRVIEVGEQTSCVTVLTSMHRAFDKHSR